MADMFPGKNSRPPGDKRRNIQPTLMVAASKTETKIQTTMASAAFGIHRIPEKRMCLTHLMIKEDWTLFSVLIPPAACRLTLPVSGASMISTINSLSSKYSSYRVAIVGYKDYPDQDSVYLNHVYSGFTTNITDLINATYDGESGCIVAGVVKARSGLFRHDQIVF